ncbi:MAG: hypothetical protein AABN33_23625 [Acidobacteriota bacterium]
MMNSGGFEIPPTQLVDPSYPAYKGGGRAAKSHQRSWWIVHTQPNSAVPVRRQYMNNPPTALVGFGSGAVMLV